MPDRYRPDLARALRSLADVCRSLGDTAAADAARIEATQLSGEDE
jgi:hypothetical protein